MVEIIPIIKRIVGIITAAIIANIENVILYLSNMKSIYARDVFYEDHDRFLKLLYHIEHEKAQIDLSEKRHNKYV